MWVLIAMAPPVPLHEKVMISLIMVAMASFLATFNRKGHWRSATTLIAASVAVSLVIAFELAFPHGWSPGLDGTGHLAALIGMSTGWIVTSRLMPQPPVES